MSRPSKARKVGLTKSGHPFAPLHPNAKDARTENVRPEPGVDDLPQSSSDEEASTGKAISPIRNPAHSLRMKPSTTSNSTIDSTFNSSYKTGRVQCTYGKKKRTDFDNIHNETRTKAKTATKAKPQAKDAIDRSLDNERSMRSERLKATSSGARNKFRAPPNAPSQARSEFRRPTESTMDHTVGKRPDELNVTPGACKTKTVFRAPSDLPNTAQSSLGDEYGEVQRTATAHSQPLVSSLASSPCSFSISPIKSSCTSTSQALEFSQDPERILTLDDSDPVCPICNASVDEAQLDDLRATLAGQSHQQCKTVSLQTEFCRDHREQDARKAWSERGYPDIDWANLPERLETYRGAIYELLQGTRDSYFRQRLQDQLAAHRHASKRARETPLQEFQRESDSSEYVGYYGGKGAAICMEFIARTFGAQLQKLSGQDSLIVACGGVASYEQLVLLPELCSLLVADDQKLQSTGGRELRRRKSFEIGPGSTPSATDLEAARKTLRESAELGCLICEEDDEDIQSTDSENV